MRNLLLWIRVLIIFHLSRARIQISPQKIQHLISKAMVETIAQKQRDLIDSEYDELMADQDPEVQPGFFEGDMAGITIDESYRLGLNFEIFPERQWPNHTVPYIISPLYLPQELQIIETALRILSFYTCIKFRQWDGVVPDYIVIWPVEKPAGCWSYVGKLGGPQIVSLQPPDLKSPQCFSGIGRPLHEIMHALGIFHEQSRPDRDKYVTIVKANVLKGFLNNFDKLHQLNVSTPFEYDFNSIMHYGVNFFSKNRRNATVVPKLRSSGKPVPIGQRINLSRLDCLKLNALYGCFDISTFHKRQYTTFLSNAQLPRDNGGIGANGNKWNYVEPECLTFLTREVTGDVERLVEVMLGLDKSEISHKSGVAAAEILIHLNSTVIDLDEITANVIASLEESAISISDKIAKHGRTMVRGGLGFMCNHVNCCYLI